jgi:hypothetical protein
MPTPIAESTAAVHPLFIGGGTPVDTDAANSKWEVRGEANPRVAVLQANFGQGRTLLLRVAVNSAPSRSGNRAELAIPETVAARWETFDTHVKLTAEFATRPSYDRFTVNVTRSNLSLGTGNDGQIVVTSNDGERLGELPAPWIDDSEGTRHTMAWSLNGTVLETVFPDLTDQQWNGAVFDPTIIDTSTASTATAYSNQRKVDRCQNGVLWTAFWNGTAGNDAVGGDSIEFWYSADDGATWTQNTADTFGFAGSGTTYTPNFSFFIDLDDYCHVVWKDRSNGSIIYRRGTPNAGRTSYTWSGFTDVTTFATPDYPDVVAFRTPGSSPTTWDVAVVAANTDYPLYERLRVANDGTVTANNADGLGANNGMYALNGVGYAVALNKFVSIDFNHTGDGKTVAGGTPHLYAAWSAGATGSGKGIRFKKATYSAGTWTWGTEREIDSTVYLFGADWWLNCLFDGTRVNIVGFLFDGTNHPVKRYERDVGDTATVSSTLLAAPTAAERMYNGTASYDSDGNLYLFGQNRDESSGSADLVYRKWTRTGDSLGSEVVVDTSTGWSTVYASAKRGYSSSRIEFIYTDGTASPYSVTYDSILLNQAPTAPTLVAPANAGSTGTTVAFDWTHNDPDGDAQARFALVRKKVAT